MDDVSTAARRAKKVHDALQSTPEMLCPALAEAERN